MQRDTEAGGPLALGSFDELFKVVAPAATARNDYAPAPAPAALPAATPAATGGPKDWIVMALVALAVAAAAYLFFTGGKS